MFDLHSKAIIDNCFDQDNKLALNLIEHNSEIFQCSPLYTAERSRCQSFLGSKAVQSWLDKKWCLPIEFSTQWGKMLAYILVCQRFKEYL